MKDMTTASFSLPWKPSTDRTSSSEWSIPKLGSLCLISSTLKHTNTYKKLQEQEPKHAANEGAIPHYCTFSAYEGAIPHYCTFSAYEEAIPHYCTFSAYEGAIPHYCTFSAYEGAIPHYCTFSAYEGAIPHYCTFSAYEGANPTLLHILCQ